jgi:hypothetical protein
MFSADRHNSRVLSRRTLASVMTFMYLLILFVPFTLHSKVVAHAITGECSGNCQIDGCSRESRAGRSCCCAQKKQAGAGIQKLVEPVVEAEAVVKPFVARRSSCCPPQRPLMAKTTCGGKSSPHQHDKRKQSVSPDTEERSKDRVVIRCGSPCGKGKLQLLAASGSSEILPFVYSERLISPPYEETNYSLLNRRMTSRYAEPPEPPPRLFASS